jgi:hypothetical protein
MTTVLTGWTGAASGAGGGSRALGAATARPDTEPGVSPATGVTPATGTIPATDVSPATTVVGRSPLDALPVGPAPTAVPYGIGTRLYVGGRVLDVAARFTAAFPGVRPTSAQRQFAAVVGAGGFAWTQILGSGVDVVHLVGRVSSSGYVPFHTSIGSLSRLDASASGTVAMPESGQVFRPDGRLLASFTGSAGIDCGSCATSAVGPRWVVVQNAGPPHPEHLGTWLWLPPAAIQKLPDSYRALGRLGTGWLGDEVSPGCWRTAPATAPTRLRAKLCSQAIPLVGADGRYAVVVQGDRARVLDTVTGTTRSVASLAALPGWNPPTASGTPASGPVRYLVPAAWESADSYLMAARDDGVLALVRCSVRTGTCRRAVRAAVRDGVDRIVTERG